MTDRSARLRRVLRRALIAGAASCVLCVALLYGLDLAFPFPEEAFGRFGRSPQIRARDETPMRVGLTPAEERLVPVAAERLPLHVQQALIASEDRRFWRHPGVDPWAVIRAAVMNVKRGHASEGASTLTMQLARIVLPQPRTLAGKAIQAFRAWQIERRHDKRFVLETYLNLVPFGGNLRGVGAASHAFFGKPADALEVHEAALLVSILPAPTRFWPTQDEEVAKRRRDRVLERMRDEGYLDPVAFRRAVERPLGLRLAPFPDLGPHAWQRAGDGKTAIDPRLQREVERIAGEARGVDGLAIVLVENASCAVRALVGARHPSPQVLDATGRPRSAGSTLKPLLYALAFDLGVATPHTRLLDLPWRAKDWSPSNFDRRWRGPVPAGEALSRSLNVPAVRLAAALPRGALAGVLRRAGLRHVRAVDAEADVDLAIGTDDVTPFELVGAYAALANDGAWRRPWLVESERDARATRICSEGAASLVVQALDDPLRARPAGAPTEGIAWKTGTSSNRRDAWSVGFTARYTAVVWRGRLDGKPDASLVGAEAATPFLFRVLLRADPAPSPFGDPRATRPVELCAETGLACGPACERRLMSQRPRHAAALRRCDVHHVIEVDRETGTRVCAHCRGDREVEPRAVAIHDPLLAAWRARVGLGTDMLPPHDPTCVDMREEPALRPRILSPIDGTILEARDGRARLALCVLDAEAGAELDVLLDGKSLGRVRSGVSVPLDLRPGSHVVVAVSPRGHSASARVRVK